MGTRRTRHLTVKERGGPLESVILNDILFAVGNIPGVRVTMWRNNTGTLVDRNGRPVDYGYPGSPDIIGALAPLGRWFGIEVKRPGERQSVEQILFQKNIEKVGGLYILAYCKEDAVVGVSKSLGM